MNLAAVDLNLLVALEALLEEKSVTRAARRVGLSQPAMSNALARLRHLFEDPLLARRGARMQLSELAIRLAPRVREVLDQVRGLLAPPPAFDPASSAHAFTLGASDYVEATLFPAVLARLCALAPGVSLRFVRVENLFLAPEAELEEGRFDLALGFFGETPAPHSSLLSQTLWREKNVCVAARPHPRLRGRALSEAQFLAERHAAVFHRKEGPGLMDNVLAGRGRARRVAVHVPHFSSLFHLVASSSLIAVAPERMARLYAGWLPLALRPLPVEFPDFRVSMLWHRRRHADPALAWLRQLISAAASGAKR